MDKSTDDNHCVTMQCNDNTENSFCDAYDILDRNSGLITTNSTFEIDTVDNITHAATRNPNSVSEQNDNNSIIDATVDSG